MRAGHPANGASLPTSIILLPMQTRINSFGLSQRLIPARETERMMKLQDVILKAMAKKLMWMEAAEIAGMSVRNMQRKRQSYIDYG